MPTAQIDEVAPLTGDGPPGRAVELGQTVLNMINCFIGAGILTIPYAFRLLGARAIVGLAIVTAINWHAALLLGRAFDRAAELRPEVPRAKWDLAELGGTAFGELGRNCVNVLMALELWLALETFLVLIGINMNIVTGVSRTACICVAGVLGLLSLELPMRAIAGCSFLSVLCMVGGLGSLIFFDLHNRREAGLPVAHQLPQAEVERELTAINAIGIFMYCFSGLPCVPNIRAAMRWRSEYAVAIHWTFGFAFLYYAAIGLLAYHCFGDTTKESFTANLAAGGAHTHAGFAVIATAMFAAKLQAGFPLYAAPILAALGVPADAARNSRRQVLLARVIFTAASVACAVGARGALAALAGLMGALLTSSTSVIFPSAAHAALGQRSLGAARRKRMGTVDTSITVLFMIFGGLFAVVGTLAGFHHLFWPKGGLGPQAATLLSMSGE